MKVLIVGWGTAGDLSPALFVGGELCRRGYDVHFIGNPYFEGLAKRAGVIFTGIGRLEDHERLLADTDIFGGKRKGQLQIFSEHYYPLLDEYFDATESLLEPDRTILLRGDEASVSLAEIKQIPWVVMHMSPCLGPLSRFDPPHPQRILPQWTSFLSRTPGGMRLLWQLKSLRHGRRFALAHTHYGSWPADHPVGIFRTRLGLPLARTIKPKITLCAWPAWFAAAQRDWPPNTRTTGFLLPPWSGGKAASADQESRYEPPDRPIVFTTGSVASGQEHFFKAALETCQQLKKCGHLVTPSADQIPANLPADIEYSGYAPFEQIFPRSAMVVHHGGIGTAAIALAAGIPQVLCPLRGDQFDNANRLQRLGVGKMIDVRKITPDNLTAAVRDMLDSSTVARHCAHWRERVNKEDGTRYAADLIEDVCKTIPALNTARHLE